MKAITCTVLIIPLFLVAVSGCEREIPVTSPGSTLEGFRIEGFIFDGMGKPLAHLPIKLTYILEWVDTLNRPNRFIVTDTTILIRVGAYTLDNRLLKNLFVGRAPQGVFQVGWDETDSLNVPVSNGVYAIQYFTGTTKKHADTVLVHGHHVATTDSIGYYVIPGTVLPIGYFPIPMMNASGKWVGRGEIASYVRLDLMLVPEVRVYVDVKKNKVTRYDVRM